MAGGNIIKYYYKNPKKRSLLSNLIRFNLELHLEKIIKQLPKQIYFSERYRLAD
jgi:hypothetical protein